MKKLLIMVDTLVCGGVEKSLLSLLSVIEDYDIDLVLTTKRGSLLDLVPKRVNVMQSPMTPDGRYEWAYGSKKYFVALLASFRWFRALRQVYFQGVHLRFFVPRAERKIRWFEDLLLPNATAGWPTYDLAIAYGDTPDNTAFVARHVRAKRKIAWIHNDHPLPIFDRKALIGLYQDYDLVGACSRELSERLSKAFSGDGVQVVHFPHIIDAEAYQKLANSEVVLQDAEAQFKIVSVGRVCGQKGFDIAIDVCVGLVNAGADVCWYIVGDGSDLDALRQKVTKLGMEGRFTFVGLQANPYPYIKACDIYVQPSRYEGYCLTLAEARVLCKPIVTTDFIGAREQIIDGETGLIVACDVDELSSAILELIGAPELRQKFVKNLSTEMSVQSQTGALIDLLHGTERQTLEGKEVL